MKLHDLYRDLLIFWVTCFPIAAYATATERFTNLSQLLDHAESISPEVRRARAGLEVTNQGVVGAKMIPNPELGFGNFSGRAGNKRWGQTDITLLQPIELGGKRGSRINLAQARIQEVRSLLDQAIAEVRLSALSTVYRIRQIKDELELIEEAMTTFSRLVGNYKKRPQLSPEQSTSLFLFQLAYRDCELQKEDLLSEFNLAESRIKQLTGRSIDEVSNVLPLRKETWPASQGPGQIESPYLKVLRAQSAAAEQELKLANSDAWPTVNIGPSFTTQDQFGEKANVWGIVLSFPIPVLNQNNGAKAVALANISSSRKQLEIARSVQETKLEAFQKSYARSVTLLMKQSTAQELHKKHSEVEAFFLRGLISSPIVIEAHRQMFENQKLYHLREIATLDIYYQMVLINGGKIEEI